jgi:hypothetical protein
MLCDRNSFLMKWQADQVSKFLPASLSGRIEAPFVRVCPLFGASFAHFLIRASFRLKKANHLERVGRKATGLIPLYGER